MVNIAFNIVALRFSNLIYFLHGSISQLSEDNGILLRSSATQPGAQLCVQWSVDIEKLFAWRGKSLKFFRVRLEIYIDN